MSVAKDASGRMSVAKDVLGVVGGVMGVNVDTGRRSSTAATLLSVADVDKYSGQQPWMDKDAGQARRVGKDAGSR